MSAIVYSSLGDVLLRREPPVHHAVEALGLVAVAIDRVGDLLRRVEPEVMGLAQHRPDAAHLEHQPLQRLVAAAQVGGQEAPGLGGQIDQDRARLEQRDRLAVGPVGIDDRRDLVVRADRQELGLELIAGADVRPGSRGRRGRIPRASRGPCGRSAWPTNTLRSSRRVPESKRRRARRAHDSSGSETVMLESIKRLLARVTRHAEGDAIAGWARRAGTSTSARRTATASPSTASSTASRGGSNGAARSAPTSRATSCACAWCSAFRPTCRCC